MDTLANRLNKIIKLRNIKPIELSEKTGIPKSAISQYMSGLYEPKQRNIYKLCKVLDINEPWLMGMDVQMERIPDELRKIGAIPLSEIETTKIPILRYSKSWLRLFSTRKYN